MIAFLRGRVLEKHPNRLIVDVGGVGYDVAVPLSTFYGAGEPGAEITLRVHTHVREDQLALFGFATPLELAAFERLITISGIGPKLALSVLSGIESRDLIGAIQRGDVARLTRIPGVGKKTAERIVIELRDRLPKALESAETAAPALSEHAMRDDLVSALTNLGYQPQAVDKVLDKVLGRRGATEVAPSAVAPPAASSSAASSSAASPSAVAASGTMPEFEAALRSALKELSRA